jgi:hypothetical protein
MRALILLQRRRERVRRRLGRPRRRRRRDERCQARCRPEPLRAAVSNIDSLLGVLVLTDDDVEAQNRVTLSAFRPDENGAIPSVELYGR